MYDLGAESDLGTRTVVRARKSAWQVYRRLLGYVWPYKARLIVSLTLALVVAASLGTMLVSILTVVRITFYEAPAVHATGSTDGEATPPAKPTKVKKDPALDIKEKIAEQTTWMKEHLGWAPAGLDVRFLDAVQHMRTAKMRALYIVCGVVLVLMLISAVASFLQEYLAGTIGASISMQLGAEMFENIMRQSIGFFEARPSGELLARFTNDLFMVNRGLAGVFVKLMREPFKLIVFLVIALRVDVGLTLLGLCVLPPVGYVIMRIGRKVRKYVRRSLQKVATMASVASESFTGIVIVKGFCMEAYETSRVREELRKVRKHLMRMIRADAAVGPVTEYMLIVGVVTFVLISGNQVVSGRLSPDELVGLLMALSLALDPVRKLSAVNNQVQTSVASAERVFEFIDEKPGIVQASNAADLPPLRQSLRFEDVHFAYDGVTEVLRGINVEIKKGEMVALVGFSGGGKSTIAKLIPRFYDVTSGAVLIDGVDIREATFESLRGQISIVTQDTILFNETVRSNIAFGRETYSEDRVRQAAQAAQAASFVEALPLGYDTPIGEGGGTLSGGQRQRLAIARAIIKDPAVLILDEATSSLDSESERAIQKAIEEFVVGRTTLVIAHRLSTVMRADRILVVDNGRIAEEGTHQELLAKGGLYRRLYETQFAPSEAKEGQTP